MKTCPLQCEHKQHSLSRRKFIATGCAGAAGLLTSGSLFPFVQRKGGKPRIRIIYSLHAPKQDRPDWPNIGFDFRPVMERINTELSKRLPEFEFLPVKADTPEAAEKILAEDVSASIDGYLVYQMNCWNRIVQTIADSGKPVLYADFQYGGSGGFLVYTARFLRNKTPNIGFVASSRMGDLVDAVRCFSLISKF